jgi:hypothetical protein
VYPRWIVEAWQHPLDDQFQAAKDSENELGGRELWFGNLPAVMRIRVTTPSVLKALRKRDLGVAKPYNFALSPITRAGSTKLHPGGTIQQTSGGLTNKELYRNPQWGPSPPAR